jgi:hypothetical protein
MTWCRDQRYWYRSRRVGGRVISEYRGAGEAGALLAEIDNAEQRQARAERQRERAGQDEARAVQAALGDLACASDELVAEVLTAAGYYRHQRGAWRRRRRRP